jgi:hypothetical protein
MMWIEVSEYSLFFSFKKKEIPDLGYLFQRLFLEEFLRFMAGFLTG